MASIDLEHARTTHTAERERLVHQLGELGADETGELTGDMDYGDAFADAAAATSERTRTIGLGAFIAAFARDVNQANIFGSVVALISGALGGNFTSPFNFPEWLNVLSRLTVNRWSIDGFADLTLFQLGLSDVLPEIGVLLAIAAVFFALGLWQFQRRIAR
jgi:ABC-2 type transport system permease protein